MSENITISTNGRDLLNKYLTENKKPELIDKFDRLTALYNEVNSVINISALRTEDDIYIKHYLDSVYAYKYFHGECCDVGCGGGFPCLPLAIMTGLRFNGIESVGKKLALIRRADAEKIVSVTPIHARAEDIAKNGKSYETVTARAVADIDKALSYCAPLSHSGGRIILYKTQNDKQASQQTLEKFRLQPTEVEDYILPGTDIKRRLFIYRKL